MKRRLLPTVARQSHEITAPLPGSSYRVLGITSRIAIYDTQSGELIATCPRAAAGGPLCWHPDSTTLFFASLADTALHGTQELRKGWKRRGEDVAFNDVRTYAFHIGTGRITHFERTVPVVAAEARVLIFQSGQEHIILHDVDTGRDRYLHIGNMARQLPRVSPDGRFAIVACELQNPFAHFGHPTILDLSNPSRRFALGWDYRFQWVSNRF